jgi:hypothetical protein
MSGLLNHDELFLKTDEETRLRSAGCRVWTYGDMTPVAAPGRPTGRTTPPR